MICHGDIITSRLTLLYPPDTYRIPHTTYHIPHIPHTTYHIPRIPYTHTVQVSFGSGSVACDGTGVVISITFNSNIGDLATMTTDVAALTGTAAVAEATKGGTTQNFEKQTLTCTATSGTFQLTFRGQTTASIAYDASASGVETALEALSTVGDVDVTFGAGAVACDGTGVAIAVTFKTELGDVSTISYVITALQGGAGTITVAETQKGDKDNVICSEKGICDAATGFCKCFNGYGSSNHDASSGTTRDCGKVNPMIGFIAPELF